MSIPYAQIPGPEPVRNPISMVLMVNHLRSNLLDNLRETFDTYGDVVRFRVADQQMVLFRHPDHIREVLVTQSRYFIKDEDYTDPNTGLARWLGNGLLISEGDFWKKQRKLVAPAFHTQRIAAYADTMVRSTLDRLAHWPAEGKLDIASEMMHITLQIVARTLFNTDLEDDVKRIAQAMQTVNDFSGGLHVLPPWVPTPGELAARRSRAVLDEIVYRLIAEWRRHGVDNGDLLSMLLLTEDENGERMSDEQVRDEAVTLLLAGHETTANALNWTWMLLSQHPQIEAWLHAELDQVLQGRAPTLADLRRLPYTEMVVKESMRLYPPAPGVGRIAVEDVEIGGYQVPKGTNVTAMIYFAHRDPRYWDDPHIFRPERFAPENEDKLYKPAYLPFGNGPRICIGNSFAMMEAQLVLATIAQRYALAMEPGQPVKPIASITLFPKDGLPMRIRQRQNIPQPTVS